MVAYHSVPVMSPWIGPPDLPNVAESWTVRSGEICVQLAPSSVDLCTYCDVTYSVFGSCGDSITW